MILKKLFQSPLLFFAGEAYEGSVLSTVEDAATQARSRTWGTVESVQQLFLALSQVISCSEGFSIMGFYSQVILPRLLDWSLSDATLAKYRQALLADVQGEVLEIGFGTGLNLAYYPPHINKITVIDSNPGMNSLAKKRIRDSNKAVAHYVLSSESLPMAENSFDSVVSTWTLCSIANVEQALKEIYRVLKPGGKFFFVEHGLSDNPKVQTWQHRLTPIQKVIADGCHLDRNIEQIVKGQFSQVEIEQFTPEKMPDLVTHLYRGVATKPLA